MPYEPDPGDEAPGPERLAFRANREVRHTVIRVITAHFRDDAAVSWQCLNFDLTGVIFDGGDFSFARFSGGTVSFIGAEFSGGWVRFDGAEFSGGTVNFSHPGDWSFPPVFSWTGTPPLAWCSPERKINPRRRPDPWPGLAPSRYARWAACPSFHDNARHPEMLAALHFFGVLDDEEFRAAKARIIVG
jgi:hypothetical protein